MHPSRTTVYTHQHYNIRADVMTQEPDSISHQKITSDPHAIDSEHLPMTH